MERLAAKYHAPVVHYQKMFDDAIAHSQQPITYWIWDGIHPTYAGHELMAEEWLRTVNGFYFSGKTPPRPVAMRAAGPAIVKQGAFSFADAHPSRNATPIVLGWSFTAGSAPVTVTSLGYLNDGAAGAAAVHSVGIYDAATKILLAPGVTVTTSGGGLTGTNATFTYVQLPQPLVLAPHTAYVIAGTEAGTGWMEAPRQTSVAYGLDPAAIHCAFHFQSAALTFPEQNLRRQ